MSRYVPDQHGKVWDVGAAGAVIQAAVIGLFSEQSLKRWDAETLPVEEVNRGM